MTEVEYIKMRTDEASRPHGRYDVPASCNCCGKRGILVSGHPGEHMDKDEYSILCPGCYGEWVEDGED